LNATPVPLLDTEAIYAGYTPEESRSEGMASKYKARMDLIDEIKGASEIIVSTPM